MPFTSLVCKNAVTQTNMFWLFLIQFAFCRVILKTVELSGATLESLRTSQTLFLFYLIVPRPDKNPVPATDLLPPPSAILSLRDVCHCLSSTRIPRLLPHQGSVYDCCLFPKCTHSSAIPHGRSYCTRHYSSLLTRGQAPSLICIGHNPPNGGADINFHHKDNSDAARWSSSFLLHKIRDSDFKSNIFEA